MEKKLDFSATLNGARDGMVRWCVTINGQSFDYGEGIGHFVSGPAPYKNWKHPKEVNQALAEYIASRGQVDNRNISSTLANFYKPTARMPKARLDSRTGHVYGLGPVLPPELDAVLYCLVSDAEAENMGFGEWCANFGYEEDSRTALALYLECQGIAEKLRKAGVNIAAERERLADY